MSTWLRKRSGSSQSRSAARQSRAAERLADDRYRAGLEGFVTVLEAQRRAFQADSEWIAARQLRLSNRVDLFLALGGGFERDEQTGGAQLAVAMASGETGASEKESVR